MSSWQSVKYFPGDSGDTYFILSTILVPGDDGIGMVKFNRNEGKVVIVRDDLQYLEKIFGNGQYVEDLKKYPLYFKSAAGTVWMRKRTASIPTMHIETEEVQIQNKPRSDIDYNSLSETVKKYLFNEIKFFEIIPKGNDILESLNRSNSKTRMGLLYKVLEYIQKAKVLGNNPQERVELDMKIVRLVDEYNIIHSDNLNDIHKMFTKIGDDDLNSLKEEFGALIIIPKKGELFFAKYTNPTTSGRDEMDLEDDDDGDDGDDDDEF